mgnify:FL=1
MPKGLTIIPMIIASFIFFTGLLNAVYPKRMWEIFESWKATREPTNAFFMLRRIAGIVAMIVILAMFLFPYLMSK